MVLCSCILFLFRISLLGKEKVKDILFVESVSIFKDTPGNLSLSLKSDVSFFVFCEN